MTMEERLKALSEEDMQALIVAAIVGQAELAVEQERTGLSDEDDSLENARWARRLILAAVEWERQERQGEA